MRQLICCVIFLVGEKKAKSKEKERKMAERDMRESEND